MHFVAWLITRGTTEALGALVSKPGQDSRDFGESEFSMKPLKHLSYANQFIYHLLNFLAPKWSGSCWMFLLKFGCANPTSYLSFLSTVYPLKDQTNALHLHDSWSYLKIIYTSIVLKQLMMRENLLYLINIDLIWKSNISENHKQGLTHKDLNNFTYLFVNSNANINSRRKMIHLTMN